MKERVGQGNGHAEFNAKLFKTGIAFDVYFWLENPDSSHPKKFLKSIKTLSPLLFAVKAVLLPHHIAASFFWV